MLALLMWTCLFLVVIIILGLIKMAALDDSIAALTAAVADNTSAVNAAVAALGNGGATPAQLAGIADATTALAAATAALKAATPA